MQILNLTPTSLYSVNNRNNLKNNPAFKAAGMEKEISTAIKNLANNPDLKDIFSNPKKKETFMECLASTMVLVAAKITKIVCGEGDDNAKTIDGDVFVKSKQSESDSVQKNTQNKTVKPEQCVTASTFTKEQIQDVISSDCAKELELLNRLSTIQEHKENAYYGYLNDEHVRYNGKEEDFAQNVVIKLEKLQNKVLADKTNEKQIEKFVRHLDDFMSNEYITVPQDESETIKELLNSTLALINDMYIDKICEKVASVTGQNIQRAVIEEAVAEVIKPQEKREEKITDVLKELPKTHGKHTETEYSLIKYMDAYKTDVPLYNKFADVYAKYCGFNRKGTTTVNGKEVQNSEIAKKFYDDLAKTTDKDVIEKTLDYYLSDMTEEKSQQDTNKKSDGVKVKTIKKKSEQKNVDIKGSLATRLSRKRSIDVNLSKYLSLNEKLERTVDVIKKTLSLETGDILLNGAALPENYDKLERMYLLRAIRNEIDSRKQHPYKNLSKITQADLVGIIAQGNFNPNIYNVHSALRFIDRFVLENISDDDLKRVNELVAEKIRVFDNAVDKSMSEQFKVYTDYHDGYYGIQIPILLSKLNEQEKADYQRCFGNQDILLTIDASGCIHTITMYEKK